jgi:hypothetical protein
MPPQASCNPWNFQSTGNINIFTKRILYPNEKLLFMKAMVVMLMVILAGCSAPLQQRFAPEDPMAFLGGEIGFAPASDWQQNKGLIDTAQNITKLASTKEEQVRAIAYYVSNSKQYNEQFAEYQTQDTVIDIFNKREGVCYDGAVLLAAMARLKGIPARVVFPLYENHAFSQVFMDGRWVNVDATFGSVQYDFPAEQPLYMYSHVSPSVVERVFIKTPGLFTLLSPTPSKQIGGKDIMVMVARKTDGKGLKCSSLKCSVVQTSEEYQPVMFGLEVQKSIINPEANILMGNGFTASLPASAYRVEYRGAMEGDCIGYLDVNLTSDFEIKEIRQCPNANSKEFRGLEMALRI